MYLTIAEITSRLRISRMTLHNWRKAGNFIPAVKTGRGVRFSEAEFAEWLERHTIH